MDRFHLHLRAVVVIVAFATAAGCTCADRALVEDDGPEDPEQREAACMWIYGDEVPTTGFFADGSKRTITNEELHRAGTVCLCLTQREYEEQTRVDEMNGMALEECKRLASQYDFVSDNCEEQYEQGDWLNNVFWAEEPLENGPPPGFSCE